MGVIIGKIAAGQSLVQGGKCEIDIWSVDADGTFSPTGGKLTAFDWLLKVGSRAIESGAKVVCQPCGPAVIVVEAEGCA